MEEFEKRVAEVQAFAKEKGVGLLASQRIVDEGYIQTVVVFRDLKAK